MQHRHNDDRNQGFTLIELLIVIGIIGFLAAAVLVAVDPVKRIQDSRDSRRFAEVNAILNAILTKQVDDRSTYNGDSTAAVVESNTLAQVIVRDASAVDCDTAAVTPSCPQLPSGFSLSTANGKACVAQLKSLEVTAPGAASAALAGAGAGNVDNGTHSYKVTLVTANGETDLGTASSTVTVADKTANGQVSLTSVPVGAAGSGVTSRKIYRTIAGAATAGPWKFLATIADNTTTTYTDNTADSALGQTGPSTNTTGGLIPNYLADLPLDPGTSVSLGTNLPIGNANTGYYIIRSPSGKRVTIGACYGEQNTSISVKR